MDPENQRLGIGEALLDQVLSHYAHMRQGVLMTDDEESQGKFYKTLGFCEKKIP